MEPPAARRYAFNTAGAAWFTKWANSFYFHDAFNEFHTPDVEITA
jgi:hypothetical protein